MYESAVYECAVYLCCSSPPFALLEADEQSGRGAVALVSEMAGALASGLAGLAKNVMLGREQGYRAGGPSILTHCAAHPIGHQRSLLATTPLWRACHKPMLAAVPTSKGPCLWTI